MKNVTTRRLIVLVVLILLITCASMVSSHCQIPCGIYGDQGRFDTIAEHITTIEKSMKQINQLSEGKPNMNQVVRWVQNKDDHADALSEIVTYYFMAQRIKPAAETDGRAYEKYVKKLTLLHKMLVYSMKAKQTTDLINVEKLRALSAEFQAEYNK